MNELVVLVPVLGRPQNAAPLVESFLDARTVDSHLMFLCSPEDASQIAACRDAQDLDNYSVTVVTVDHEPGPGDFARKINGGYRLTAAPFIFQAADDVVFCPGWDRAAMFTADLHGAGVVGTNDHGNPRVMRGHHSTHSLIRRAYVETQGGSLDGPGIVFHEGYGHQWVDTELVELAKSRGQFAFAADSAVCHEHPFWDKTVPDDDTYRKGQASAQADHRLYQRRRQQWTRPQRRPPLPRLGK